MSATTLFESSAEAERLLLGGLLIAPDKASDVFELVSPDDFAGDRCRRIAQAIYGLASRPDPWDLIALKSSLRASGDLDAAGGPVALAELVAGTTSSAYVWQHAQLVRNSATLRRLSAAGGEIARAAAEANPGDRDAVARVLDLSEATIYAAGHKAQGSSEMGSFDSLAQGVLSDAVEGSTGFRTGYYDLDATLVDMRPTEFNLLAGRPGTGKTAMALNLLVRFARSGAKCLFVSLEMGLPQLVARVCASEGEVHQTRMRSRTLTAEDRANLQAAADYLRDLPVRLFEDSGPTVGRIAAQARRVERELKGLDFIFIDYAQLMSDPTKANRYEAMTAISNALKGLAREMQLVVIALVQLNRDAAEGEPKVHQLRDSGAFEQDADRIMLLHCKESGQDADEIDVIVGKNRHGAAGRATLLFQRHFGRFDNLALGEMETIKP